MKKQVENEIKVGFFVALGLLLTMGAIIMLGSTEGTFVKRTPYVTKFRTLDGLIPGAKVMLGGINVGVVETVDLSGDVGDIEVRFLVNSKYTKYVRKDSMVDIVTQGVLGDKFIMISTGSPSEPELAPGAEIANKPPQNLLEVFSKSEKLMTSLTSIAGSLDRILKNFESEGLKGGGIFRNLNDTTKHLTLASQKFSDEINGMNLKASTRNLASILEKINNGTGTLGALVNDPGLYDDAKSLMGGANRNRLIRNLVRQTVKDGEPPPADEKSKTP